MSLRYAVLSVVILSLGTCATGVRVARGKWMHYHSTTTAEPHKIAMTNLTRFGDSNLCKECSTYTFDCSYYEYRRCDVSSSTNNTVIKFDDGSSSSNSNSNSNNRKDRRKRDSDPYEWRRQRRWNKWHNNFNGSTDTPMSNRRRERCKVNVTKTCTERKCTVKCCDDTPMDTRTNTCDKKSNKDGTLDNCMNGGTLHSRRTHCTCPTGFIGIQCQHRVCSLKCQNGGQCQTNTNHTGGNLVDTTYNDDYCVCPSDTTGRFCETKRCDKDCKNNGTCTMMYRWAHCICAPGFTGDRCELEEKAGDCPSISAMEDCHWHYHRWECSHDTDCSGDKKCCKNACYSNVCTDPHDQNMTCTYNNVTHALGSVFTPDPCRVCTCNESHVDSFQGAIQCVRLICPDLPVKCRNVTTPESACCPVCTDDPDLTLCNGNYTYPYFANCPDDEVVLDVGTNTNSAEVNIDLRALDCRGNRLDVAVSDERLVAGTGEQNYRLVSATSARDGKGNFAECLFHVRVRDPHPPEFVTCPMDMEEKMEMPVTWPIPIARDNVGLSVPPTSRHHPGVRLPAGRYMIQYWAEDYEGNIARCSFVVTVVDHFGSHGGLFPPPHGHGTEHHLHPHPHGSSSSTSTAVGVSVACVLFVLLLAVLAVIFYRRYRRVQSAARASPTVRMGAVNGVDSGMNWNANNIRSLPRYSLTPDDVMSPPVYSRVDEMISGLASGGQEAGELPSKNPLPE